MLAGLVKLSAVTACGLAGGALFGAFSSSEKKSSLRPASSTNSEQSAVSSQSLWTKTIEPKEPILKCQEHGKNYEVYLVTEQNKPEAENIEIGLEIRDINQNKKIVWGQAVKTEDKWNKWELRVSNSDGIYMKVPSDNRDFQWSEYISVKCQESKFESELISGAGREQNIKASVIKFTISPTSTHQKESSIKKEYDIKIAIEEGSYIKWKHDFSPKVILQSRDNQISI